MLLKNALPFVLPIWLISVNGMAAGPNLNSSLSSGPKTFSLGINCRGNFWCPWVSRPSNHILRYLLDWMNKTMHDTDIYFHGAHIACTTLYADRSGRGAAFCVYTQGHNVPPPGINGSEIKRKLTLLNEHGCFACGSIPLAEDNDPNALGILSLNYVLKSDCKPISSQHSPICRPNILAPAETSDLQPSTAFFPVIQLFNLTVTTSFPRVAKSQ